MKFRAAFFYATCCLLWGSTWLAIKIGLTDLPPFFFGGVRMLIASLLLMPVVYWRRKRDPMPTNLRAAARHVVFVGALQLGISYAFVFFAQTRVDSGLTAVLFSTFPIWAAVFAHAFLPDEPFTFRKGLAGLLGLGGVLVLQWPALAGISALSAAALLPIGAAGVSAVGNVHQKKHLSHVPPALNLCVQAFVGAVVLLSLHAVFERGASISLTPVAWGSLLYLSVFGTVITFLCLFWLLARISIVAIGIIPLVDTLIAVTLGAIVLHEPLGWRLAVGAVLVLSGAAAANLPERPSRFRRAQPT